MYVLLENASGLASPEVARELTRLRQAMTARSTEPETAGGDSR
jgi:hypothetical protein